VEAATRGFGDWSARSADHRAVVLRAAARALRERRFELAAIQVRECAKPWAEADADVCEAIDFLEYYARGAAELEAGRELLQVPGERNTMRYAPRGVAAVIAPWNFPLAIPAGMTAAALAAGNSVVLKPAEQSPASAGALVAALHGAGVPADALALLPGYGEAGAALVRDPGVHVVAFTGSAAVGLEIVRSAAAVAEGQHHVKRVVAEMGGKNALIVDADADLDQAVPIVVWSAFGYAGQKCSACARLVVVDAVHDQLVERLVGAAGELRIGHPQEVGTEVGPLIDADAYKRVRSYVELAPSEGEVALAREDVPDDGYFVGPTVVLDVPRGSRLATEEIFGPILTVMRAESFDEAIALANDTDYALTAGVVSRSPSHIRLATDELRAGNVYVNRSITGAVVGRQPFGGFGLSGVGSKAGGPDYLHQFVDPRAVSENTLRQGFAPTGEEE
jgi:RHH-type proline utilization regulon transcriptional repressor/proline dehydrogenase/delta 1-pyrroline-5-carboxylate dehydrogenase